MENKYDPKIWKSTSNKFKHIAKLPDGMTGLEAVKKYDSDYYNNVIMRKAEMETADYYRRVIARNNKDQTILTEEEYRAFRAAGGESSW